MLPKSPPVGVDSLNRTPSGLSTHKTKKHERKTEKADTQDKTWNSINFSNTLALIFGLNELFVSENVLKSVLSILDFNLAIEVIVLWLH